MYNSHTMGHTLGRLGATWRLRAGGGLVAALFVAYLIELSPHLVHHLFDEDHAPPACSHLAQSQHNPALQADPPALIHLVPTETVEVPLAGGPLPSPALSSGHCRAPPRSVPSA